MFFSSPGEYQIEVVVSNDYCPSATDNTVLFIQTQSGLSLEMPALDPLCDSSDPVSLTANPGGGGWSGFGINSAGLFTPALIDLGTYTFVYQLADDACMVSDNVNIELAGETVTTTSDINECKNAITVQLDS